jgi:hypothetical protein
MKNKFFKVVECTTNQNTNGNGKNQRLTIQAFVTESLPLDQAPIDVATRVQLMLAGINSWDVTAPISQSASRYLFSGMINSEGARMKDGILFNKLNIGDIVAGTIERFDTTPYMIGDNTVNHITTFVFDGEDAITVANRSLGQHGACVLIDGKVTATSEQLERRRSRNSAEEREAASAKIAHLLAQAAPAKQDAPVMENNPE